jgi:hypothetical protein
MSKGRLRERAGMEQAGDAWFAAGWVVAIDEEPEREERQVLGKRHSERQAALLERKPPARFVKREPEERPVQRVDRKANRTPSLATRERLAENGDIGVVVAKETHVERLDRSPEKSGDSPGCCGLPARMHTL